VERLSYKHGGALDCSSLYALRMPLVYLDLRFPNPQSKKRMACHLKFHSRSSLGQEALPWQPCVVYDLMAPPLDKHVSKLQLTPLPWRNTDNKLLQLYSNCWLLNSGLTAHWTCALTDFVFSAIFVLRRWHPRAQRRYAGLSTRPHKAQLM
jgi:hypothetical protein